MVVVKGATHHWWPTTLQGCWINSESGINRLINGSKVVSVGLGASGGVSDGHNVNLPDGWAYSFEPDFHEADDCVHRVVPYVQQQVRSMVENSVHGQLKAIEENSAICNDLGSIVSGLLVRYPRTRRAVQLTVNDLRSDEMQIGSRDALIAMNLANRHIPLSSWLGRFGNFLFIQSTESEFVFGDGIYSNIDTRMPGNSNCFAFVALAPDTMVLCSNLNGHVYESRLNCIFATEDFVEKVNRATIEYSIREVFFRSQKPILKPGDLNGVVRQYQYHKHPYFQSFLYRLSQRQTVFS